MKFLIFLLFVPVLNAQECPDLTGKYSCTSEDSMNRKQEYSLEIQQSKVGDHIQYTTVSNGITNVILTDAKTRVEVMAKNLAYFRLSRSASCANNKLIIDRKQEASKSRNFDFVFLEELETSYYEKDNGSIKGDITGIVKFAYRKSPYSIKEVCVPN